MTRLVAIIDRGIDVALVGVLVVGWLIGVVILFVMATWWLGIIGLLLGVPFAIGLYHTLTED